MATDNEHGEPKHDQGHEKENSRLITHLSFWAAVIPAFLVFLGTVYTGYVTLVTAREKDNLAIKAANSLSSITQVVNPEPTRVVVITATPAPAANLPPAAIPFTAPTAAPAAQAVQPIPTPTAPEMKFFDFAACPTPCSGTNATFVFPEKTKDIYFTWNYQNIPRGAQYTRTTLMRPKGGSWVKWSEYQCIWPGPSTGLDGNVHLREPKGLRSGDWQVIVTVNDVEVLNQQFSIEGSWNYWDPIPGVVQKCYGLTGQ